eukprot:GDKH01015398.1.p1 GENE.GDKH01015398.1~~GDKH01015398.1.p1  ORF type:complete len:200 (+),score=27.22 GDKH01015398.1:108-707(+)
MDQPSSHAVSGAGGSPHRRSKVMSITDDSFTQLEKDRMKTTRDKLVAAHAALADLYSHLEAEECGLPHISEANKCKFADSYFSREDAKRELSFEYLPNRLEKYIRFCSRVVDGEQADAVANPPGSGTPGAAGDVQKSPAMGSQHLQSGKQAGHVLKKHATHTGVHETPLRGYSEPLKSPGKGTLDFPLHTPSGLKPFSL